MKTYIIKCQMVAASLLKTPNHSTFCISHFLFRISLTPTFTSYYQLKITTSKMMKKVINKKSPHPASLWKKINRVKFEPLLLR